ncbi:MAG TPA: anti-sigma factor, partial [Luteibaculaceae bacterium]|nr:anti-sigma factor [Luteibaculaceae bacterium]
MPNKQGRAMLYCDLKTGKVAVKPMGLPALDNQHQYQLWALIDGKPVDMGMIPNDMIGKDQLAMLKSVQGAQAFAITREPFGGKAEPTIEEMIVMAKVG